MDLLRQYFELQEKIYGYFGYVEDWAVIPLQDYTGYYWRIIGTENNGEVEYSSISDFSDENCLYSSEIYTQRHLPKWVYRAEEFTMICLDTKTDFNRFLGVFDNKKERKKVEACF